MNTLPGELKNILLRAEVIGRKNWLHAVNILEKAAEEYPGESSVYLTLGDVYNRHRMFEQAIDAYQKSLITNPKDEHLLFIIGNCYLSLSDYKMALYYYDQVSGDGPELNYNKALAYAYSGDHEFSIHYLKILIRQISDNANLFYFLVEELLRLHKYGEGLDYLQEMEKRFGIQRYQQILLGFIWSYKKIWLKSYFAFKKADELGPITNPEHLHSFVQSAWQIGQLDKAIELLLRGLEFNPRYGLFYEDLIRIYLQKRDYSNADRALSKAFRMLGNSDPLLLILKDKLHKLQADSEAPPQDDEPQT